MLRVQLTRDQQVRVCAPVGERPELDVVAAGSTKVACEECGRTLWVAPGPFPASIGTDGQLQTNIVQPDAATLIPMCPPCAQLHFEILYGKPLNLREVAMSRPFIECPRCHRVSYNPHDVAEGYCGNCHDWTRP